MNSDWRQTLRDNVTRVRAAIAAACQQAGRDPADVLLLAVTKYADVAAVPELLAAGVFDLGENRVQQLVARASAGQPPDLAWPGEEIVESVAELPIRGPRWHMIGHVQRNKIKALLPHTHIVHSLDSPRLAQALSQQAQEMRITVNVLVEVNSAGEATKTGAPPTEIPALVAAIGACPGLRLRGLMTMTPYDPNPETSRRYFADLRALLERLQKSGAVGPDCRHLSMGMSQDYPVAIAEGATIVRVGSALFAGLPTTDPRQ